MKSACLTAEMMVYTLHSGVGFVEISKIFVAQNALISRMEYSLSVLFILLLLLILQA